MAVIDATKEKSVKVMVVDGMTVAIENIQENGNGKVDSVTVEVGGYLIGCKRILGPKGPTVGAAWHRHLDNRPSGNPEDDDVPKRYINCAVKVARGISGVKRLESRRRKIQRSQSQARLI